MPFEQGGRFYNEEGVFPVPNFTNEDHQKESIEWSEFRFRGLTAQDNKLLSQEGIRS